MKTLHSLLLFIFVPQFAFAWGDLGHQTVGEIAEQIVAQDPHTQQAIRDIIGVEPYAVSATFPDHVRSDERFGDFAPYHFTTIFRDPHTHIEKDALTVLNRYPALLTASKVPREVKMLAFRYLVHVVGDVHQPLHVGNEFDRGGNMCDVFWLDSNSRARRMNLHSVWDGALVDKIAQDFKQLDPGVRYYGYKELAAALVKKHADLVTSEPSLNIREWIAESHNLGENQVYPDQLPADKRPYCQADKSNLEEKDIPVLDANYASRAAALAERRIVLAGVRLGKFLIQTFKDKKTRNMRSEEDILTPLKLTND